MRTCACFWMARTPTVPRRESAVTRTVFQASIAASQMAPSLSSLNRMISYFSQFCELIVLSGVILLFQVT